LPTAAASRERRTFLGALGAVNLVFLSLDVAMGPRGPAALIAGRLLVSATLFWVTIRLGYPATRVQARRIVVATGILATAGFSLLAWASGGSHGPYLGFLPLLPLLVIIAIPDEPAVPITVGLGGAAAALAMQASEGASPRQLALWTLAFSSTTLYGWVGSLLWRRMRQRERDAEEAGARARGELEDALWASRRSEALYRAMAAHFPDGVIGLFDERLRLVLLDGTRWMDGAAPGALAGRTLPDVLPPEVAREVEPACRAALRGEAGHCEVRHEGRDVIWAVHPVLDGQGGVMLGLLTAQDVTERRSLETRLVISSRLAALGTLVAGVAHEINNPLSGQMASQVMAREELREMRDALAGEATVDRPALLHRIEEALSLLEDAHAAGRRITRIVRDLSLFARPDPERSRVRLEEVVESALRWLPDDVAARASVRVERAAAPEVNASAGQLGQVLANLVSNAALAIPPDRQGTITIRIGSTPHGAATLDVADDGTGIDPAVMGRIFDPFFTTREIGQGMGLGLPICHAIVAAHAGSLTARSTPGRGSTFRVELPPAA
jgi:PAS domain S-box-containing protein